MSVSLNSWKHQRLKPSNPSQLKELWGMGTLRGKYTSTGISDVASSGYGQSGFSKGSELARLPFHCQKSHSVVTDEEWRQLCSSNRVYPHWRPFHTSKPRACGTTLQLGLGHTQLFSGFHDTGYPKPLHTLLEKRGVISLCPWSGHPPLPSSALSLSLSSNPISLVVPKSLQLKPLSSAFRGLQVFHYPPHLTPALLLHWDINSLRAGLDPVSGWNLGT